MTYKLKSLDINAGGWPAKVMMLRDGSQKPKSKAELQAHIASGDYFTLLATRLDQVSQSLQDSNRSDYVILEDTICDLLYLHEYYKVSKK